nr:hypothetical protein [Planococcus glaciei]
MKNLSKQFQRIVDNSTLEDLKILGDFLENFEKKAARRIQYIFKRQHEHAAGN